MTKKVWFGRCIFLSWYCDIGTCQFCYRATIKSRISHAEHAKRSLSSILVEALLAKNLRWRIEFLTGGYKIYPMPELVEITRLVSSIYGKKIWLNLGVLSKEDLNQFRPYVKGIVASIECINPKLHDKICPDKQIQPYEEMFSYAGDLKKSITIVIGLGEVRKDFSLLKQFIEKHKLNRITFYALKPVTGTPFSHGPTEEEYTWWISETRKAFPDLQIIAGITPRTVNYVLPVLEAGADAITKFPATKKFGSADAISFEKQVKEAGHEFVSTLTKLPDVNWDAQISELDIPEKMKRDVKEQLEMYLKRMKQ
ncbi:radical SAM protein [Candidatus Woesearchaeota archaeon]|nr:radical SAM protein [Candidatus Woesearchaeota archaeon]